MPDKKKSVEELFDDGFYGRTSAQDEVSEKQKPVEDLFDDYFYDRSSAKVDTKADARQPTRVIRPQTWLFDDEPMCTTPDNESEPN